MLHFLSAFLLLVATILLMLATISAPIINNIQFATVTLQGGQSIWRFGMLGYCETTGFDSCSPHRLGYNLTDVVGNFATSGIGGINTAVNKSLNGLTYVFVLHPVAMALAFIALLFALCPFRVGKWLTTFITLLAFIVSLVAMAVDFATFSIVFRHVKNNLSNSTTSYGNATWMTLVATIILLIAAVFTCLSCCTANRRHRKAKEERNAASTAGVMHHHDSPDHMGLEETPSTEKRPFWRKH